MLQTGLAPLSAQLSQTKNALRRCNEITQKYGLSLSENEMEQLAKARFRALHETGRVEFGEGVLDKLILAFCDSPYLEQDDYAQTLHDLQELFYHFKKACREELRDDELIAAMKLIYDEAGCGSLELLSGVEYETMLQIARTKSLAHTRLARDHDITEETEEATEEKDA